MSRRTLLVLCIFFGYLGVHKFAERKYGMGTLYLLTVGIFYIGWLRDIYLLATDKYDTVLTTKIPEEISIALSYNTLPCLSPPSLLLKQNEICHFYSNAILQITSTIKSGYKMSGSKRDSVILQNLDRKVAKAYVEDTYKTVNKKYVGVFYITNMRIIFSNQHEGFEFPINALTSIEPSGSSVRFQIGNHAKHLKIGDCSSVVCQIIQMIHRSNQMV